MKSRSHSIRSFGKLPLKELKKINKRQYFRERNIYLEKPHLFIKNDLIDKASEINYDVKKKLETFFSGIHYSQKFQSNLNFKNKNIIDKNRKLERYDTFDNEKFLNQKENLLINENKNFLNNSHSKNSGFLTNSRNFENGYFLNLKNNENLKIPGKKEDFEILWIEEKTKNENILEDLKNLQNENKKLKENNLLVKIEYDEFIKNLEKEILFLKEFEKKFFKNEEEKNLLEAKIRELELNFLNLKKEKFVEKENLESWKNKLRLSEKKNSELFLNLQNKENENNNLKNQKNILKNEKDREIENLKKKLILSQKRISDLENKEIEKKKKIEEKKKEKIEFEKLKKLSLLEQKINELTKKYNDNKNSENLNQEKSEIENSLEKKNSLILENNFPEKNFSFRNSEKIISEDFDLLEEKNIKINFKNNLPRKKIYRKSVGNQNIYNNNNLSLKKVRFSNPKTYRKNYYNNFDNLKESVFYGKNNYENFDEQKNENFYRRKNSDNFEIKNRRNFYEKKNYDNFDEKNNGVFVIKSYENFERKNERDIYDKNKYYFEKENLNDFEIRKKEDFYNQNNFTEKKIILNKFHNNRRIYKKENIYEPKKYHKDNFFKPYYNTESEKKKNIQKNIENEKILKNYKKIKITKKNEKKNIPFIYENNENINPEEFSKKKIIYKSENPKTIYYSKSPKKYSLSNYKKFSEISNFSNLKNNTKYSTYENGNKISKILDFEKKEEKKHFIDVNNKTGLEIKDKDYKVFTTNKAINIFTGSFLKNQNMNKFSEYF